MNKLTFTEEWLSNARADVLAGIVVALALIPEALAFSIIAGVDPKVGLYSAFSIAVVSAIAGGRPAMISAATGAVALVIVSLVKNHGVEYVLAAGILGGVLQIGAGLLRLDGLMRFVSRSHHRLRQRIGDSHFHGAVATTARRSALRLRDGRRRSRNHLPSASLDQSLSFAISMHHRPDRHLDGDASEIAHGRRYGIIP